MNQIIDKILQEIEKVIVGKNENVEKILQMCKTTRETGITRGRTDKICEN